MCIRDSSWIFRFRIRRSTNWSCTQKSLFIDTSWWNRKSSQRCLRYSFTSSWWWNYNWWQGRTINFKNSIIVLTSNLGSQAINDLSIRNENITEIKKVVDSELKKFFKPEFLNRLDEIVIFNNLELNAVSYTHLTLPTILRV